MMKKLLLTFYSISRLWLVSFLLFPFSLFSQSPTRGLPDCRRLPTYAQALNFDPNRSAFSTSDSKYVGLIFTEIQQPNTTQNATPNATPPPKPKVYQHHSWKKAGYLGPMIIDARGNVYIAPLPLINILLNDPKKANQLYQIDPSSGEMKPYFTLPTIRQPNAQNPFGIIGMGYDCETQTIYLSTVHGSDRQNEVGRIYAIKTGTTPAILDKIENIDGFGMGIGIIEGKKQLLFGKARTSDIFSIEIGADGKFIGQPQKIFSLEGMGIRGDDRARKIRFAENGDITINGVEFYFNLIAPTERQETPYTFRYDPTNKRWVLIRIG